jgi:hypothetical protein
MDLHKKYKFLRQLTLLLFVTGYHFTPMIVTFYYLKHSITDEIG